MPSTESKSEFTAVRNTVKTNKKKQKSNPELTHQSDRSPAGPTRPEDEDQNKHGEERTHKGIHGETDGEVGEETVDACALGGLDRARLYPYTRVSSCHETQSREPEEEDKEENGVLLRTSFRNVEGVRDEGHRGGTRGKTHKSLVFDRDCCASAV